MGRSIGPSVGRLGGWLFRWPGRTLSLITINVLSLAGCPLKPNRTPFKRTNFITERIIEIQEEGFQGEEQHAPHTKVSSASLCSLFHFGVPLLLLYGSQD